MLEWEVEDFYRFSTNVCYSGGAQICEIISKQIRVGIVQWQWNEIRRMFRALLTKLENIFYFDP